MKIEDRSMLMKLKTEKSGFKFDEMVSELLEHDEEIHPDIAQFIARVFKNSDYVSPALATNFIIKTRDRAVYSYLRETNSFRSDVESLIKLLQASVPDEMIESRLCDILYQRFKSEDWVWTIQIMRALCSAGSINCLPTLEVLHYDFSAEAHMAKLKSGLSQSQPKNFDEYAECVTQKVVLKVWRLLDEAIDNVKERNDEPKYEWRH